MLKNAIATNRRFFILSNGRALVDIFEGWTHRLSNCKRIPTLKWL